MRIPLGKQGENNAVRVVWPGIIESYVKLYGGGDFFLAVRRPGDSAPYPAVVVKEGADLVWTVGSADTAKDGYGNVELTYTVGGVVAKSQTWGSMINASLSGQEPTDPPEPQKNWVDAVLAAGATAEASVKNAQKAAEQAVNGANQAANATKTASDAAAGAGSAAQAAADAAQESAKSAVKSENAAEHSPQIGENGNWFRWDAAQNALVDTGVHAEGKDGNTPKIAATKTGKTTSITADGVEIAQVKDGEDAAADPSLGITSAQVGQIAKITAVDADGKPTQWEAVDMAGEEKAWTKIIDVEITEATMVFEATGLDNVTELYCEWAGLKTASETAKRELELYINDIKVCAAWVDNNDRTGLYKLGYSFSRYNGLVWYNIKSPGLVGNENTFDTSTGGFSRVSYMLAHGVGAAGKIKISAVNADNTPVTGQIRVWAR
nr:MAG TPA: hypothetical protein [Caudoviricetes sp.]